MPPHRSPVAALTLAALALAGCGDKDGGVSPSKAPPLSVVGRGRITNRITAELAVRGTTAYTSTWGRLGATGFGNAINIWDVSGSTPQLVDSLIVSGATTLGDVQVSDDGRLLIVATERTGGSIVVYDLANARRPQFLSRYSSPNTSDGVHTAEVQRVGGKLYAFLSVDPAVAPGTNRARLTIVDLSDPAVPAEVFSQVMGNPFVHDVHVRDGILFTALWNDGLALWDVGGGGRGGSAANPVRIGSVPTVNGAAHNVWWFHDPSSGARRYAFVGEEGPAVGLSQASGDVHVVDVSDMAAPREVAFYHVEGAGTHNFSMDEAQGILYAAFYNAGVRALDVRGDLSACTPAQKAPDGRCDLGKMGRELAAGLTTEGNVFVWGVQLEGSHLYASDMLSGIWKLNRANR